MSPTPIASWSGPYIGLGFGPRSTVARATVNSIIEGGGVNTLPGTCAFLSGLGECFTSKDVNGTALRISPYLGWNWMFAPRTVVGIEVDFGYADQNTTLGGTRYPATGVAAANASNNFTVKTTWDASIRPRLGFLLDPTLMVYATAGVQWMHIESTSSCNPTPALLGGCGPPAGPVSIANSTVMTGWTIGGGIEAWLRGNWMVRAEYRYADFGTISHQDARTVRAVAPPTTPQNVAYDLRVHTHTATLGLAYKFGAANEALDAQASLLPVVAAQPAAMSWSGLYAGVGLGFRGWESDVTVNSRTLNGANALIGCPAIGGGCLFGNPYNDTAFRGGPYAGWNWQLARNWVVGVEGDWFWADKTTTEPGRYYPVTGAGTNVAADSFGVRTTWDASLRARAGHLVRPAVLVFVTGGVAWLQVESISTCSANVASPGHCAPPSGPSVITNAVTMTGWTIGGGLEAMIWRNWLLRGEYRYADFGSVNHTNTRVLNDGGGPAVEVVNYDLRMRTHTVTFGLAYLFNNIGAIAARN